METGVIGVCGVCLLFCSVYAWLPIGIGYMVFSIAAAFLLSALCAIVGAVYWKWSKRTHSKLFKAAVIVAVVLAVTYFWMIVGMQGGMP